jgi:hypothetical protein
MKAKMCPSPDSAASSRTLGDTERAYVGRCMCDERMRGVGPPLPPKLTIADGYLQESSRAPRQHLFALALLLSTGLAQQVSDSDAKKGRG